MFPNTNRLGTAWLGRTERLRRGDWRGEILRQDCMGTCGSPAAGLLFPLFMILTSFLVMNLVPTPHPLSPSNTLTTHLSCSLSFLTSSHQLVISPLSSSFLLYNSFFLSLFPFYSLPLAGLLDASGRFDRSLMPPVTSIRPVAHCQSLDWPVIPAGY